MKRLLIALALTFALTASAQTAADKIAEGRAALVAHNMPAAKAAFAEAVTLDGGNQTARALLGITQLFDVTSKAGSDAFLDGLGLGEVGRDVYRWDVPLPRDGNGDPVLPTDYNFTTVANYWLTTLVPESEAARTNLAEVTDDNFLLTLTTAETKMPMSITLDKADILMAQACLRAAEFLAHLGSGQNLDANLEDILEVAKGDMLTLQRIINANPNFLTAGSSSERLAAKQALQDMIALYRTAATALRARPAGVQRLFMLEPADFAAEAEFQFMLDRLEQSITAPVDMDGAIVYTAPLFDAAWSLRAQLPPFTATGFDVTTIPSATFGGVITGLTKESIAAMFSDTHDTVAEIGWEWVSPKPQGNTLGKYLALASGKHLAIGNAGTYLTSLNGTNWTANRIPGVGQLRAAVEHAGRIVMVTYDGSIFASDDDAVTWRRVFNDAGSGFHGVTYGGGKYVAVGDYGLIATSVDGESWSNFYPNGVSMLNVLHTGSLFVAVGVDETNGNIVINTSPDGMAWTTRVNAFHSYAALWGLAQNGSTLVAVGGDTASLSSSNKLAYSTDGGLSWTIGSLLASPTGNIGFNNVAYVNGKFVAVGTAATIATSTDGITWGTANSGETFLSLVGVGGNGSTTYVTSGGGVILSSTDNVTFTRPMSPPFSTAGAIANPAIVALRSIDGFLYAGGGANSSTSGVILRSSDGLSYSVVSSGHWDIFDIIKQGSTYYGVGRNGAILTSADGAAWTVQTQTTPFTTFIRSIAYLNGQFIMVGNGGMIRTSATGAADTWTLRSSGVGVPLYSVAYGNGRYVAVGGNSNGVSAIVTSEDGATWTVRNPFTGNTFLGVTYYEGMFTAVGTNGQISRSDDGINWWSVGSGDIRMNLTSISVLDGRYYATMAAGSQSGAFESQAAVLISSDGEEWVRVTQGTTNLPNRIELFGGRLYTGNNGASILRTKALTALAAPSVTILTPPSAATSVAQGSSLALVANSTGEGVVSYQWKKDGVDIPDATGPGLTLDNVQAGDAGSYTVVVTNAAGSDTSDPIVVSVNATAVAPKILFHPESQTLNVGFNVTLSVEATGTAPLTYVWKKDGVVLNDGGNISGATTPELTLTGLLATNGGSYTVEVSNGTGTATSLPAILTVDSNPAYNFTIMAGSPGLSGSTDATGWGARFDNPQGIAVDGSGNVYVTSPSAQTIRKVTAGNVVTTVAGSATVSGYVDDVGTAARFNGPRGLALNAAGTMLYVADTNNGNIRRVDLSTNTVTTWATGLNSPLAIVLDATGNAYVASWDHTIRKISPDGLTITLIAGATYAAGSANNTTGTSARFNNPMAIAIDPAGANLYVADSANALIRKVSLTAPYAVTTYAGLNSVYGYADGPALSGATFSNPMGVAVDPAGNVIVADNSSDTIRKISPNGFVRTIGGQPYWRGFNDGPGDQARFGGPTSIAADANGNLYLLENANHIVRRASASASPLLPVIQFSPHDQTVAVGEDVLFGVVATGVSTLSYQWQKDGVNLGGATNPTLPLTNVQSADAGRYRVLVTSAEGSALSAEAVLTVTVPPAITGQPAASLVVASGQPIALSVTTGDAGATYQWRRNGFEIPGAIGANLNLASATRQDAGYYYVVINGLNGAVVSAATDVRVAPNAYPGDLAFDASFSANPLLTLSTRIFAAIPLAGGKWLVGGDFVQWDNAPRTFLARLNADYSLDETFTPPLINGFVNALAVAADGSIYVGGDFTAVDGHAMPGLFRLTPAFRLDLAWRPRDNPLKSSVTALAAMADGRLIVARATTMPDHAVLNGANVLRRLYADGTLDAAFSVTVGSTNANPRVNALAVEADGDVAFAGGFATVNGTSRQNLARVDASGVLDANFAYTGSGSGANNTVWSLTLLADGRYLVGGNFGQVAGTSRNRIAIVNADGTLDASFVPFSSGTNGNVLGVARQSDGKIIAAGTFTQANGQGTDGLVRLTSTGAVDLLFPSSNTGPSSSFNTVASPRAMFVFPQSNGSIALFGGFTGALHQSRIAVAVVAANGQLQAWPNANLYRPAYANSGYILPGNQTAYFGSIDLAGSAGPLGQAVRVNDNGSLDVSFPQGTGYDLNYPSRFGIYRAVRQGDGKFLAVGDLAGYNGNWGYRMLRIGADGSFDGSFDAGSGPSAILPQVLALSGGKTLLYNLATGFTFNGTPIGRIARLNADGSVDFSFQTGPGFQNASAQSVAPNAAWEQPDGKIVVSGPFTTFNGATANGLARLNPDGSLDASFSAGSGPVAPGGTAVISITGLPDGRLVIAGNLTTYNGAAANRVAVLQADGSLDASFNAPAGIDAAVAQVIAQEDGKFILYGDFGATATTSAHAMRVSATGVIDPTFHLRGITGAGAGSSRLMLGDDGSVYAYGGSPVSFNYGVPLAIARYRGAAAAPTIAADPVSASVTTGGTAVFAVRANGTGPFTYQWRRNGVDLPGENSSVLILDNIDGTDGAAYDVVVTGPTGATATSAGATLTVGSGAPVILDQPFGRRAVAGGKVLFRVGAGGTAPFTYQWRKNGVDIGGATGADLLLDPVGAGDAGTYSVAVTNAVTTTVSAGADLTVLTPDAVLWQQFTDMSTEHAPARLLLDGNGKVYVPWSVQDRNPDMAGGRLAGALARFDEATGAYDPAFALDRRYRGVSHGVLQPDGKLVLAVSAGDADTVIRVDGTGAVDPTFTAPLFARGIRFLTRQPDGRILVAAVDNLSVNAPAGSLGTSGPTLFRLEANGAVDAGFTPATLNLAGLLFGPPVVDASGRIYLAGGFGSVNGTPRTNIARLLANGTLDTGFAATLPGGWASTQARAVALQSDGRAVVVGDFRYGTRGTASDPIVAVRFNTDGTYDSGFAEPLRSYLGLAGLRLRHLEILGDDRILAVSDRFVRLLADGSPDATFQSPGLDREVFWFSRDASGRLYVADLAGVFGNAPATLLPAWGNGVARFLADGSPDFTFQTGGFGRSQYADSGRVLTNGDVIVAGAFNRFGSTRLAGVARFSAPDTLTAAQVAAPSGSPANFAAAPYATVAAAAGDQTYVASVLNLNGTGSFYANLRRINADGTTDAGFNPTGLPSGYNLGSASLFAAPGGQLILAQATVSAQAALNGNTGDAMLRLNPDGTRDNGYTPGLSSFAVVERDGSNAVTMIRTGGLNVAQVLPDGRALIVVSSVDGTLKLQRLNADGTLDAGFTTPSFGAIVGASGFTGGTTYDPVKDVTAQFPITTYSASNLVRAAVQMPDGKVYVGGRFNLGGGAPRGLVRLNADGSLDGTFTGAGVAFSGTDAEPYVTALAVDATGRLYVAGRFTSFNGTALPGLFRLDASGAIDTGWAPGFGVRDTPYAYASLVIANNRLHVLGTAGTGGDALPAPYRAVDLGSGLVAQTINFTDPADRPFTTDPITLTATATSGLPVTFTVQSGPASVTGSTLTLSGAGTVVVRASQTGNGTYAAAPDVDQSFVVGGSFSLWQASVFSEAELLDGTKTGPNTVYGQDGIPNLVKYALGLDPKVNATSGLPEVSTDATYWLFTYTRPADRADVTYTVQYSTNLTTWSDVPGGDHVRIATGSTETWRARYLLSGAANLFFRLKVTQ